MAKKTKTPSPKKGAQEFTFLGLTIRGTVKSSFIKHLLIIATLSLAMKLATIFLTTSVFGSFIDLFDITYYLKFALKVFAGQVPYAGFTIDYPQGAFLSILLPLVLVAITGGMPALLAGNPLGYVGFHQALMCLFDLGSALLVYLIALRLYDGKRAFLAGVLYTMAFSASYFVLTKYDAYPTFFLLLAVALFLYGRETGAYLAGAFGFLVKWYPVLALPYFLILDLKAGVSKATIRRNIGLSILLVLVFTLPFLLMNPSGFITTYTINTGFSTLAHGFIYYLDFIARTVTGVAIFSPISLLLAVIVEIALLWWFYRQPRTDPLTLCIFIFFAVAAFILTNKIASPQYLQWIAPFMAIFLAGSVAEVILFFVAQLWWFLEFPVLYNVIYNNITGYGPAGAGFPAGTFLFFTVKFALIFAILWLAYKKLPPVPGGEAEKAG